MTAKALTDVERMLGHGGATFNKQGCEECCDPSSYYCAWIWRGEIELDEHGNCARAGGEVAGSRCRLPHAGDIVSRSKIRSCGKARCYLCKPHRITGELRTAVRRALQPAEDVEVGELDRLWLDAELDEYDCCIDVPGNPDCSWCSPVAFFEPMPLTLGEVAR